MVFEDVSSTVRLAMKELSNIDALEEALATYITHTSEAIRLTLIIKLATIYRASW
jgi:hypothetical protein